MTPVSLYINLITTNDEGGVRHRGVNTDLQVDHVPAIGDMLCIWDGDDGSALNVRVVDRLWQYASLGSRVHPYSDSGKAAPATVDLLVEPCPELHADEAPLTAKELAEE